MKKLASKVAHNRPKCVFSLMPPAQIQLKSQFLFHKNLPPRDFSIMTLVVVDTYFIINTPIRKIVGYNFTVFCKVIYCRFLCLIISKIYSWLYLDRRKIDGNCCMYLTITLFIKLLLFAMYISTYNNKHVDTHYLDRQKYVRKIGAHMQSHF